MFAKHARFLAVIITIAAQTSAMAGAEPPKIQPELAMTLGGHRRSVNSVAFSPNGMEIVTASSDPSAFIWDARTGAALVALGGYRTGHL